MLDFRWMLKTAIYHGPETFRLQDKILETRRMNTDIMTPVEMMKFRMERIAFRAIIREINERSCELKDAISAHTAGPCTQPQPSQPHRDSNTPPCLRIQRSTLRVLGEILSVGIVDTAV
jgi:hypothetical protein